MKDSSHPKWYFSVWFIIAMLFLVLGPLALPLLWKSPRFPRAAKVVLTVVVFLYTALLLGSSGVMVQKIMRLVEIPPYP